MFWSASKSVLTPSDQPGDTSLEYWILKPFISVYAWSSWTLHHWSRSIRICDHWSSSIFLCESLSLLPIVFLRDRSKSHRLCSIVATYVVVDNNEEQASWPATLVVAHNSRRWEDRKSHHQSLIHWDWRCFSVLPLPGCPVTTGVPAHTSVRLSQPSIMSPDLKLDMSLMWFCSLKCLAEPTYDIWSEGATHSIDLRPPSTLHQQQHHQLVLTTRLVRYSTATYSTANDNKEHHRDRTLCTLWTK